MLQEHQGLVRTMGQWDCGLLSPPWGARSHHPPESQVGLCPGASCLAMSRRDSGGCDEVGARMRQVFGVGSPMASAEGWGSRTAPKDGGRPLPRSVLAPSHPAPGWAGPRGQGGPPNTNKLLTWTFEVKDNTLLPSLSPYQPPGHTIG